MKVAVVVDWLTVYSGAERVVEQLIELYPDADIFSLVDFLPCDQRHFLKGRPVTTSFIQKMPFAASKYRNYLALMPLAIEQFDLSAYNLVVSSSHAVAKGVITGPDQTHVCYIHSPIRYAWDLQHQYLRESGLTRGMKSWFARWVLHYIRSFDVRSANGVDQFVANSAFVGRRVWKCYRREAEVVFPPVDVDRFQPGSERENFYITASRLVPYKRVDLIVKAFTKMPERTLYVVGDGPDREKVEQAAEHAPNIHVLGFVEAPEMQSLMKKAKAFVFAAEEDFGISPVEAMACGTPVIAFGKGGVKESVVEGETGLFFMIQSESAIVDAVNRFDEQSDCFSIESCRARAEKFSVEVFRENFSKVVKKTLPSNLQ